MKYIHTHIPEIVIIKNKNAAPEPFPYPNIFTRIEFLSCTSISGSKTESTKKPPKRYPSGIVKNCNELRTEYTRPCIYTGICMRIMASRLVFISGINIKPKILPIHQINGVLPNASKKFSVPIENNKQLQITFTRLSGSFITDANTLPKRVVMPITMFTTPSAFWLPPFLDAWSSCNA